MKKIVLLFIISIVLFSCNTDDREEYSLEVLPLARVIMPMQFAKDSVTEIPIKYLRPSNCYFYHNLYYQKDGLNRTVAIYSSKLIKDDCQLLSNDTITIPLRFQPSQLGTYKFKFWKGTTTAGVDEFFEYDAIVNH